MKSFSTFTITFLSFMVMPFTVLAEKQGFVVFKTPPGLKGKDANDKGLPQDMQDTLNVLLTAGWKEFLADGSNDNRQLRGINDERHLPGCPNPSMSCAKCTPLYGESWCELCQNCGVRSLVEQLFPRSLQRSDTTTNPMDAYKTCKQVNNSDVQDDISDEAAKEGVKKFATGFDRSTVKVYICER